MNTVNIPKKLTQKGELVIIPRKEYERLLGDQQKKQAHTDLDKRLTKAIKNYQAGEYYGPFKSATESRKFLKSRKNI